MKYVQGSRIVDAIYSVQKRTMYKGNPCIEALPDSPGDEELIESLYTEIPMDDLTSMSIYDRKDCIQSLAQLFIPTGQMCDISRKIMSSIKEGYVARNPLLASFKKNLSAVQRAVINKDASFSNISGINANACGFCLVGDSGMGKTSIVNHTLSLIPQVIEHTSYNGEDYVDTQLVWLKIECPHDASIKGLCIDFFTELDRALDDNTRQRFAGRATQDEMVSNMAFFAKKLNLGILVIDEIQNISAGKNGGAQRMKNLITQMVNKIGIPILLVGTPSAIALLSTDLITIRRSCGQMGLSMLYALEKNSLNWDLFTKKIWRYQWTINKAKRTPELTEKLYSYSRGNLDATIKLFMEAQRCAIDSGTEIITESIIERAANGPAFSYVFNKIREEYDAMENMRKKAKKDYGIQTALSMIDNDAVALNDKSQDARKSSKRKKEKKVMTYEEITKDIVKQDVKF